MGNLVDNLLPWPPEGWNGFHHFRRIVSLGHGSVHVLLGISTTVQVDVTWVLVCTGCETDEFMLYDQKFIQVTPWNIRKCGTSIRHDISDSGCIKEKLVT